VQVAPTGVVNLPLIGGVTAAGRTARELERDIAARLATNYLRSPQVSVTIKEAASQSLTVDGAVVKPGVFPMNGAVTLLQALAQAQGFNDVANRNSVIVSRVQDGRRMVASYDAAAIQSGKAADPTLQAGDIVVVEESGVRTTLRDTSRTLAPITSSAASVLRPW
ncbi:MAG: polysaccharide biosynthesis/export family protein, partial [Siculibacillus sp.]